MLSFHPVTALTARDIVLTRGDSLIERGRCSMPSTHRIDGVPPAGL
jgi:hypothetical protein